MPRTRTTDVFAFRISKDLTPLLKELADARGLQPGLFASTVLIRYLRRVKASWERAEMRRAALTSDEQREASNDNT